MTINHTNIPDVIEFLPKKFSDDRGFFTETYNRRNFSETGFTGEFVQDNHAMSVLVGTVRGLHFQLPPFAQTKLVRVVRGRVLDVVVDIRRSSPTFGQHVAVELRADQGNQLLVPVGFAHGYCTLEPNCEVVYKVDQYYSPAHDRGMYWNDPALAIAWPVDVEKAVLSHKDEKLPLLQDIVELF